MDQFCRRLLVGRSLLRHRGHPSTLRPLCWSTPDRSASDGSVLLCHTSCSVPDREVHLVSCGCAHVYIQCNNNIMYVCMYTFVYVCIMVLLLYSIYSIPCFIKLSFVNVLTSQNVCVVVCTGKIIYLKTVVSKQSSLCCSLHVIVMHVLLQ